MAPLIGISMSGAECERETKREAERWGGPTFPTIGRSINELIEAHARLLECQPTTCLFVCECENGDCEGQLEMTLQRYRLTREDTRCFMVVPGHESPDDLIVERQGSWLVIKKTRHPEKGSVQNLRSLREAEGTGEEHSGK